MNNDKNNVLGKISLINAVDGFDPEALAVEYNDMNSGKTRKRLPVMVQVAWFRLKHPDGRFTLSVSAGKDCFVAIARIYKNYMDPVDCYLSEASASRGYLPDKPTVSPREWAQTAALGIALRNAGFGLQFHIAGESFDEPAVNELGEIVESSAEFGTGDETAAPPEVETGQDEYGKSGTKSQTSAEISEEPAGDPLENAKKLPCPIGKYKGKTLGDMITLDPSALVWVANKFTGDVALIAAAKFICEHALAAAS